MCEGGGGGGGADTVLIFKTKGHAFLEASIFNLDCIYQVVVVDPI